MVPRIDDLIARRIGPAAPSAGTQPTAPPPATGQRAQTGGPSFADALQRAETGHTQVRFSAHAQRRLESRAIALGAGEMQRLEQAVDTAARKGARDSLILMDELALIVNIENRTVVTAVDKAGRQDNVFTNIDTVVMT